MKMFSSSWFFCVLAVLAGEVPRGDCQKPFNCSPLSPLERPAMTVYQLKPQDIKVVMALGDSITAGFGMMGRHGLDVIADFFEYRGQSWSIGMDEKALTVPNFLRHYNQDIVGGSLGHHVFEVCYEVVCPPSQYTPKKDVFNAAQSGAMTRTLVSHEFKYLLKQLKKDPKVDMMNDWKLLTLFIGANDLCLGCSGTIPKLYADDYEKYIREVLEETRRNVPKVFVNLVLLGNISEIHELSLKSDYCSIVHHVFPIECLCAFSPGEIGKKMRLEMDEMALSFNKKMEQIAADYALKRYSDFAVVLQPFMSNSQADKFPVNYLSSLDCFHPSLIAHQTMALALWNNMISPAAQKSTTFNLDEEYKCPTNETLLYTW